MHSSRRPEGKNRTNDEVIVSLQIEHQIEDRTQFGRVGDPGRNLSAIRGSTACDQQFEQLGSGAGTDAGESIDAGRPEPADLPCEKTAGRVTSGLRRTAPFMASDERPAPPGPGVLQ